MTTREARQILFNINSKPADTLRHELFHIEAQDEQLPAQYVARFNEIPK